MRKSDYFKMGELIDAYSGLLTRKQRSFLELYYFNNFSIDEIAELKKITKQGVYDLLKRAETRLERYEEKLGLLKIRSQLSGNSDIISGLEKLKRNFESKIDRKAKPEFIKSIERLKEQIRI